MGDEQSIAIVIPAELPASETYTVSVSESDVRFRAGYNEIATIPLEHSEVFRRLSDKTQVGLVEYPEGQPFPDCITAVAYVELRRVIQ